MILLNYVLNVIHIFFLSFFENAYKGLEEDSSESKDIFVGWC